MSKNILEKIKYELQNVVNSFVLEIDSDINFDMIFNQDKQFGDITTNILMRNKNLDANIFLEKLKAEEYFKNNFSKIEIAKNNYINFFLKSEALFLELERIKDLAEKKIILETKYSGKNILIEHSSPNLFKPFNIGLFMNNTIGESIVQMMRFVNADVKTMSFPSDISLGIAKAIYILKNNLNLELSVEILGAAYVEGVKFYDQNLDKQEEIRLVAKNLFEKNLESEDWKIYEKAKDINIKYFLNMLENLGSNFDSLIYESEAGVRGERIIKENMNLDSEKEIFEVGDGGAIVFDTKKKKNNNDENSETIKSVFINSEGHPTYEAKDTGLIDLKFERNKDLDFSFFVTDNEQISHFEVVLKAASHLGEEWNIRTQKSKHLTHGRMTIKGEKMSTRIGNDLLLKDIFLMLENSTREKLSEEKIKDFNEEEKKDLIKNISLSALRISILKSKPGVNIDFDPDTSLNFEGATGPYLLYTFARSNSILEKSMNLKVAEKVEDMKDGFYSISENQKTISSKIVEFESVIKNAIENLAPQLIVKYLFELAQAFNTFYAKEKLIDENDLEKTRQNIYITKVFAKTLKSSMNMIGIKEVERM